MIKYRLHWTNHPLKDQEWYEHEIVSKMMSEDEVARELDINYSLSVSGKVFSSFREDRHVITKEMTYNKHKPIYRIWDFGKTNATLWGQIDAHGRRRILHERVLTDSGTQEQINLGMTESANLFPDAEFQDICDPAGSYEDHRGSALDIEFLQSEHIYPQYSRIIELPTRERKVRGRKLIMKDLQSTPQGEEALAIYCGANNDWGCPMLKKALQGGYCYKKDANGNITDSILERHPHEDVIDCLIYFYLETNGYAPINDAMYEPIFSNDYINPYTGC